MNLSKSLVAVSAILFATTLASAQAASPVINVGPGGAGALGTTATGIITVAVNVTPGLFGDLKPKPYLNSEWVQKNGTGANATIKPSLLAALAVESNISGFDVKITSKYGGLLRKAGTPTKGDTLVANATGSTLSAVKLQLFVCADSSAAANIDDPCAAAPTGTEAAGAGKVDALIVAGAGVRLAKAVGKTTTGWQQADLGTPATPGATPLVSNNTTGKAMNFLHIGIYGGLQTTATTPVVVDESQLVSSGTYSDDLTFNLVSIY